MTGTTSPSPKAATAVGALLLVLLAASPAARASDPMLARYTDDPSKVFWFLHISDTHIDTSYFEGEELRLEWALTNAVSVIGPWFVAVTGDLTDGSNGLIPGIGRQEDEWRSYRTIVDSAGMTVDFYFDLPGNHDSYNDGGLSYYLQWSLQGSTRGTTQPDWTVELPFGKYHFVGVATPDNHGYVDPLHQPDITGDELAEIRANLEANTDSALTLAAGHHDYASGDGGGPVDQLFSDFGVPCYFHGHNHDYRARVTGGGILIQRIDSLGEGSESNVCVHAVDSNCVSHHCVAPDSPWPLAVITAPIDARLDDDDDVDTPHAPTVPTSCTEAPLRALVFDPLPVSTVTYWWNDSLEAGGLDASAEIPGQWTGTFNAAAFTPGIHTLNLEVIGTETRDIQIQVLFENRACDVTSPPPDEDMEEVAEIGEEPPGDDLAPLEETAESVQDASDASTTDVTADAVDDALAEEEYNGINGEISGGGCSCGLTP